MEKNLKYTAIMVLSFMLGGFLLSTYSFMAYSILWSSESNILEYSRNNVTDVRETSTTRFAREVPGLPPFIPRRLMAEHMNPFDILTSPLMMFCLVGGLISMSSALSIWTLTHNRAMRKVKEDLTELYLTDEEKQVMAKLGASSTEMTQKELTDRMGYSRVKTHRILQRLETKKLIRKIPNGQTYKIVIEDKT
ncbi:MAG: MarR family transcriptional regulator [Candidatus Altiarchaeota archaeon]